MYRNFKVGAGLLAACVLFQAPAFGIQAAPQPAAEKKVCKEEIVTGSIRTKRICHTKAEWAEIEGRSRSELDRARDIDRSKSMVNSSR